MDNSTSNSIFHRWVPQWLQVIFLLLLFFPLMSIGSVYSACSSDTVGTLQIWSEDFTFISLCAMIGLGCMAPFFYKIVCRRRHRLMFLSGFAVLLLMTRIASVVTNPWVLALLNFVMGQVRFVLIVVNLATLVRVLLKTDLRNMFGPHCDARTTTLWDKMEREKFKLIPIAIFFLLAIAQFGTVFTAWIADRYGCSAVYEVEMLILVVLSLCIIAMERVRTIRDSDESASTMEEQDYDSFPRTFRRFMHWAPVRQAPNVFCLGFTWGAAAFVLVYGKTLDWFDSPQILTACVVFVLGLVLCTAMDKFRQPINRYFQLDIWHLPNVRRATLLYIIAMAVNCSSALTNMVQGIGLSMDTYVNNMIGAWIPLGYAIAAIIIIVAGKKGIGYRWLFALAFSIFAWTMWFTANQVQLEAYYDDILNITIIRNIGMFMLYSICMIYAYQRLPYRYMPTWVCIMFMSRSVMGPVIGGAVYSNAIQYLQQMHLTNLAADITPETPWQIGLRTSTLQSMILTTKELATYSLYVCLLLVILMLIIPWRKRTLKPEEVPDEDLRRKKT